MDCIIYDTTLRDGEQMPGVVFSSSQKKELVFKFVESGVGLIDFMPAISKEESELCSDLVFLGYSNKMIAATMMREEHINLAKKIGFENIILFTSVSDIHLENKLGISREENLKRAKKFVSYSRDLGMNVYFAGEDSSRAHDNYLFDFISEINPEIEAFVYCDTLGVLTSRKTYEKISGLTKNFTIGLHMHNDFGQAVSNSLSGIEAGAKIVSGTFTGIGERAGNASLEEILVSLKYQYGIDLGFNCSNISEICSLVEKYSGVEIQNHKAVIGKNAFCHESGIHVDGVLKNSNNYEPYDPIEIGSSRKIVYGKHSGLAGILKLFGSFFNEEKCRKILQEVKELSIKQQRSFSEEELINLYLRA